MQMQDLQALFVEQLRDLYNAENQLVKALPKMAKAASNPQLKTAFTDHLAQTKGHVQRLEQLFSLDHLATLRFYVLSNAVVIQPTRQEPEGNGDDDYDHECNANSHLCRLKPNKWLRFRFAVGPDTSLRRIWVAGAIGVCCSAANYW